MGPRRRRAPDDPLLHAAVVAYASDMSIIDSMLKPHEVLLGDAARPWSSAWTTACGSTVRLRADRWLLFDQDSPNAYGARGLARGLMFDEEGRLVVSVVQEGLVRVKRRPGRAREP